MSGVVFVVGVNGIGKSSVIPFLKKSLNKDDFVIHDFDERGVPDNADRNWRQMETFYWMNIGKENLKNQVSTIICGFSKPAEIRNEALHLDVNPKVILLNASGEVISERIMSRYVTQESLAELTRMTGKTPEKFVQDNVWISSRLREESISLGYTIIDTSDLSPNQVSDKIVSFLQDI